MQPYARRAEVQGAARTRGITSFAMELVPRISRAQSMDALSSQAAIAGYKAVLIAADHLQKFLPMLTTAAGTIRPSQVLDHRRRRGGTAGHRHRAAPRRRRRGLRRAQRHASEQVKSLGAKFVDTGRQRRRRRRLRARADGRGEAQAAGGAGRAHRRRGRRRHHRLGARAAGAEDHLARGGRAHAARLGDRRHRRRAGRQLRAHARRRDRRAPGREDRRARSTCRPRSPTTPARCTRAICSTSSSPPSTKGELAIDWNDEVFAQSCLTRDGADQARADAQGDSRGAGT